MKLHKNVYLWYAVTSCAVAAFTLPIKIIYFVDHLGFSNIQAFILLVAPLGISALLEIPTGSFADRFGRVKTFRLGVLIYSLCFIGYLFIDNFYILATILVISGVGLAMQSGCIEALVHDSLKSQHQTYAKVHSNKMIIAFVTRVITVLFSGIMFTLHPKLPFLGEAVFYLLSLVISFFFIEERLEHASNRKSGKKHTFETLQLIIQNKSFTTFIVLQAVFIFCGEMIFMFLQPYFKSLDISIDEFGLYYSILSMISALGAFSISRLMKKIDAFSILLCMMLLSLISASILLFRVPFLVYIAILPTAFAFGFSTTLINTITQKQISSKYQATALSIVSMCGRFSFIMCAVILGFMLDQISIEVVNLIIATLLLVALLPFFLSIKKHRVELALQKVTAD